MPRATKTRRQPPPRPARDLDTEARILDAARRVFIRRGTSGARVQEIAAEAGVNQALIHYYFGSKEALAERVFVEAGSRVVQVLVTLPDPSLSLEQLVERFVHGYIDAVREAPFIPAYLLAEAHQHPERLEALMRQVMGTVPSVIADSMLQRIGRHVAERVAAGTLRPMTPRQFLVNVMSLTIFPFVARPVLGLALGMDDAAFGAFLDERRRELPGFIVNALRP